MIMKICTIYDNKAEAYLQPMFFQSLGQAERSFGDVINDSKHAIGQHPADYTMVCVGNWDESKGDIEVFAVHIPVAEGIHLVTRNELEKI